MKISGPQPFYKTFPILDNHYNSNFKWVNVKGKCNYFVDASYRHRLGSGLAFELSFGRFIPTGINRQKFIPKIIFQFWQIIYAGSKRPNN